MQQHFTIHLYPLYDYTLEYYGLFADTPQHAHPSHPQILHRSGEKKQKSVLDCFHTRNADLYGRDDS